MIAIVVSESLHKSSLLAMLSTPASPYPHQGSTGVLKTSRLPTWVVNFGRSPPTPKFCWIRFCVGSPLVTQFLCGQVISFGSIDIALPAAECINVVASLSLSSRKDVSTAMLGSVQPLHCHHRHHQHVVQPQCTCADYNCANQRFQLLPHHDHHH